MLRISNTGSRERIKLHFNPTPEPSGAPSPDPAEQLRRVAERIQPTPPELSLSGFDPSGIMKGRVVMPLRLPDRKIVGYCGLDRQVELWG